MLKPAPGSVDVTEVSDTNDRRRHSGGGPPGGSAFNRRRTDNPQSTPASPSPRSVAFEPLGSPTPEPAVVEAPTTGAAQRAFPGGRARLPTLSRKDTEPELTIVGAAFAREHSNDGSEHHRANSFTEYFSYESLFEPVDSFATPLASPASKDPCGVLGLAPDADHQAIVRAYRKLVKQHHPDRLGDVDEATRAAAEIRLHEITAAYRELQREHQARRSDIDSL